VPELLWDASALIKNYLTENGSEAVEALFQAEASFRMISTFVGYAETAAILHRRLNQGGIPPAEFTALRNLLRDEVLLNPQFELLSVTDGDVLTGIALTDRHNLNSTDASILAAFLARVRATPATAVLVAADQRLLRAATAEGLETLNPEKVLPADVPALLASY
jgi:predicted nucleic acid-binding protein